MDDHRFDDLTKRLAGGTSRRGVLKTLAGTALGGIFARAAISDAAAITCPAPQTDCNGTCVNKRTDPNNCGVCGKQCIGGQTCVNGACRCPNDPAHTSEQQVFCAGTQSCINPRRQGCCPAGQTCLGATGVRCSGGRCCPTGSVCNDTNGNQVCGCDGGTCVSGTCCPAGQECGTNCCTTGQTCDPYTLTCFNSNPGPQSCAGIPACPGDNPTCAAPGSTTNTCNCGQTTEGGNACFERLGCTGRTSCTSGADCGANQACVVAPCCDPSVNNPTGKICVQLCGTTG